MEMLTKTVTYYSNIAQRNITVVVTVPAIWQVDNVRNHCISVAMATATETS